MSRQSFPQTSGTWLMQVQVLALQGNKYVLTISHKTERKLEMKIQATRYRSTLASLPEDVPCLTARRLAMLVF